MANTTFATVLPAIKAVDFGDGTYGLSVSVQTDPGGADLTFNSILPPLKAVAMGDGTYAMAAVLI